MQLLKSSILINNHSLDFYFVGMFNMTIEEGNGKTLKFFLPHFDLGPK